ncbi:hypothetical protein R1sor_005205 [Riccia sorocarpa]|uniref:Fe2OG dioxygenase domain-containing protein n=1 Tax=Riccia sorocarpa TaxID=122646 RepID=A0ABD3HML4_9MARC
MALSEAGQWLEESLLKLSADTESGLQLDADLVYSLVSYCEMATPSDAAEYLMNIVADDRCKEIVTEYLRRRGGVDVNPQGNTTQQSSMQAYVKPRDDEVWSTTSKKTQRQKTDESAFSQRDAEQKSSSSGSSTRPIPSASGQKVKQAGGKGKRGGKGVSLAEAAQGQVIFKRSGPCNCQCTRHNLVNNCLSCGRIVCEQEGEGPCTFCGALVLREGSDYAGLDGVSLPPVSEADVKAEEFKNRLVEYDRTSAARTTVIDDQSEYFNIDGNTWLTDQEKAMLKKRQEEEERIAEERRKRVVVTIDLLGRKVVMADQGNAQENAEGQSILGGGLFVGKDVANVPRIKPNPFVKQSPLFTEEKKPVKSGGSGKSRKWSGATRRSSRIQHDDPVVEALIGHKLEDIGISSIDELSNAWQGPKSKMSAMEEEAESIVECRLDMGALNVDAPPSTSGVDTSKSEAKSPPEIFDICLPRSKGKQNPVVLAPSFLKQRQAERTDAGNESFNLVLDPGLILLKRWLTIDQQVDIVRQCRRLGVGPGGFYRPQYREEDKMHLRMMCLGMQWQPTVRSYEPRRTTYDNALAPPIPEAFLRMVDKALSVAQILAAEDSGAKSKMIVINQSSTVPSMAPDICIVNFYEFSGNLGMHQDKDESPESLKKGLPVVSFSIGDSGEFTYGWDNDPETAQKVVLESGDVIIFGGPSRMLFHGVTKIFKDTAPGALLQRTNLRPGRLNLTFRQF